MKLAPLTEAAFLEQVLALARLCGWRCYHQRPARTRHGWRTAVQGDAGFPDLVLVRDGVILFWELKVGNNRLSPQQSAWLAALRACGLAACVLRPGDWGRIEKTLRRD